MQEGVIMMGKNVAFDQEKAIKVFNNNVELSQNDFVSLNDELLVKLEPKVFQMVFEVNGGGTFIDGQCKNKNRISASNGAKLLVSNINQDLISNDISDKELKIVAVWAKSYATGVKIVVPFILRIKTDSAEL
jgi:hypothetical protein